MAAGIAGCGSPTMRLTQRFRTARALLSAPASVVCRLHAEPGRLQSTGPSEPGAFQPPRKPVIVDKRRPPSEERRFLSPEFIPPRGRTNPLKFYLERKDMLERRKVLHIPEFYVGSILRVTTADPYANGKTSQFLGICIQRSGAGFGATFILRNTIEGQGIEICFELYNPRIHEIQVVKLEKRLDDNLMYLRDALPEYSTFDMNMKPVITESNKEVPINELKVKMKPKPWSKRWERPQFNIKGIRFDLALTEEQMKEAQKWSQPWLEFDMMREYDTSKLEAAIWDEIQASKTS
ncbi:39S ribosomal protein L19, mitochondrial isoform X2 [Perognathus longimembris pacificus]|uniref:39S ribosomal protein L19, mitochondrial isoform X2 n=1 Tax=Perognathus longimembris pacificus TaxID=214514 RepID=UPI002019CE69|nr:39S ribosomal protein L19, mitochondrial isoform X2 [Perognathus longimembris pacificus]